MEQIINTQDLQLFSLMQAMNTLGFELMRTNKGGFVFFNPSRSCNGNNLISMNNAITMYNKLSKTDSYGYDAYYVNQFLAAKVVQHVKFQYSKKKKQLMLHSENGHAHYVRCVDDAYWNLFGLDAAMSNTQEVQEVE